MRLTYDNGTQRLLFPAMSAQPGFFHGVFLRDAMNAQGGHEIFNLGMGNGASEDVVRSNRQKMLASFGDGLKGVYGRQVHGKEVGILRKKEHRHRLESRSTLQLDGDALITDLERAALVILVADCQPVMVIDPVKRVVANIHSGWRGSVQNIIGSTIRRMCADFGSRPEDLICGIGPSLGPCCAEFIHYKTELPESFRKYGHTELRFDFWQASRDQLIETGVRPGHISVSGLCTRCNPHFFFSYRREKQTGRFAAVIGIEPVEGRGI